MTETIYGQRTPSKNLRLIDPVSKMERPPKRNNLDVIPIGIKCQTCGKMFFQEITINQGVIPKYCPEHRTDYQRKLYARTH